MTKPVSTSLLLLAILTSSSLPGPTQAQEAPLQTFHLSQVRLLDGPFKNAQDRNLDYIMAMDPDRLLAPFLQEAGLPTKAEFYGNWESSGLSGHIGGHYLSALSLMYASTGDEEVLGRLQYMISDLKRAQAANGNGYLGGVPGGKAMWDEIAAGQIKAEPFGLNDKWVPWYNLHKLYAGLRDAYLHAGIKDAGGMLVALANWTLELTTDLSDEQIQTMLHTEHGGMNEIFADVAAITGDPKYLQLARRFSDRRILDPLLREQDELTGLHANTQIPKVIGFERIAELAADTVKPDTGSWEDAAAYFWDTVVNNRSVAIGGNSVREHFNDPGDFESMVTDKQGPETCNTYNMLRLTRLLYQAHGSSDYVDYYERALYNHILATQHPEHGGLVYFTPMRPGHYRVYSQPDEAMWCCVGSGIESQSKYGAFIYAHRDDELFVNLFIASTLDWKSKGIRITQETGFPDEEVTTIRIDQTGSFTLNLRHPGWVERRTSNVERPTSDTSTSSGQAVVPRTSRGMTIAVNGMPQDVQVQSNGYVRIARDWQVGDQVHVTLPMHARLEQMPDDSGYYAVLYGPIVLAAKVDPFEGEQLNFLADDSRMGHVAEGPVCPGDAVPTLEIASDDISGKLVPAPGESLTFRAPDLIRGPHHDVTLIPFFRLHDARYVVYWPEVAR
ncbi:MAG TPA: glycoside hydrolase family 127 protein [Rhodothermales bacterium]|nr:glycoside hydrolase family 127 protein [Rhodothermales bacterium]